VSLDGEWDSVGSFGSFFGWHGYETSLKAVVPREVWANELVECSEINEVGIINTTINVGSGCGCCCLDMP
jgi:hypothetical protein